MRDSAQRSNLFRFKNASQELHVSNRFKNVIKSAGTPRVYSPMLLKS
jgi:hypothetical protein